MLIQPVFADSYNINYNIPLEGYYYISGYVNDSSGNPINLVFVINETNSTTTNSLGYYQISMTNGSWNFTFSKNGYNTSYKVITISGANVSNQNMTLNSSGNFVNFSFTNFSISERQIYQFQQATLIKIDVADSDGYINNVSLGITLNSNETQYTMTGGNNTWEYSFKSGTPGSYLITHFYATDNASGTNTSIQSMSFDVVPLLAGSKPKPIPTTSIPMPTITVKPKVIAPIPEQPPIDNLIELIKTKSTEFNALPQEMQWSIYLIAFLGIAFYLGQDKKKRKR
jgi:hypothetical protein